MEKILQLLRKFPMSTGMSVAILIVSLTAIPDTPLKDITLIDKWAHIGLYAALGFDNRTRVFPQPQARNPERECFWAFGCCLRSWAV